MIGNDFPRLGINTQELIDEIDRLLAIAEQYKEEMGAVNWGDIGVSDIEYRLSMLHPEDGPRCVVLVEEASPDCYLQTWLSVQLAGDMRFPNTCVECEW